MKARFNGKCAQCNESITVGIEIEKNSKGKWIHKFCSDIKKEKDLKPERVRRVRSIWWYLAPIILGILGGLIAYLALRNDDLQKAKKSLYFGLIWGFTQIILLLYFMSNYGL